MQIPFLSDLLVAVASLNLKVPNIVCSNNLKQPKQLNLGP